jgi:hypothetical protein
MIVGTGIVLAITAAAGALGPSLSGLLAAFPVYVTVLALFAHHLQGPEAAINVVRGLQVGLFGTIVFFLVVNSTIESLGVVVAFAVAIAAVAAVQSVSLRLVRRDIPTSVSAP